MLKHISSSLKNTKKYQLWQEAYWLVLVNQALKTFVKNRLNLENQSIKAFVKLRGQSLHVKVVANEPTILTALRISQVELLQFLEQNLNQKLSPLPKLQLSFRTK